MSRNLVKHMFTVAAPEEEKRIIDSNELVRKRLEAISRQEGRTASDGFVSGLGELEVIELPKDEDGDIPAEAEAESLLEQAQMEAENILAGARAEAEGIRREAQKQAEAQKSMVIAQAKEEGYNDGLAKAKAYEKTLEQEYQKKHMELEDAYQQQVDVLEPEFVDIITDIYEHIFHIELSSFRNMLAYLISAAIRGQEDSRKFLIHVSGEDYSYINMQKKQMLAGAVGDRAEVDVVEDLTLAQNECIIETENGIFDCGLGTQLSELKRKLMLLAWSKEG